MKKNSKSTKKGAINPENSPFVREYPQVIKYMGSKAKLTRFVAEGIAEVYDGGPVCDLFAGACSIPGALGHRYQIITNDIQAYSRAIAHLYLSPAGELDPEPFVEAASELVKKRRKRFKDSLDYPPSTTLRQFNEIEARNRALIDERFSADFYHFFAKYYSGTWWSANQCFWIDALRQVADEYLEEKKINQGQFNIVLTALMHAMAYASQGTGHYAQYRDAKSVASMKDINIYRQKDVALLFTRKLRQIVEWNNANVIPDGHQFFALDYVECLARLPRCTVYADPPYAFVHYSRFYHAIETLVRYDSPSLQRKGGKIVKGRYREGRHQSPFCIRSQVEGAFEELFKGVARTESNLVLSYSNTGMISLERLMELANDCFGKGYKIWATDQDHMHMTMGRRADHSRSVKEALILAKRR